MLRLCPAIVRENNVLDVKCVHIPLTRIAHDLHTCTTSKSRVSMVYDTRDSLRSEPDLQYESTEQDNPSISRICTSAVERHAARISLARFWTGEA